MAFSPALTEAQLRNRLEPEKGIFIAESPKVIRIALDAGYEPAAFLMERKWIERPGVRHPRPLRRYPRLHRRAGTAGTADRLRLDRGVLCAMRRPALPSVEEVCKGARRIAVLEDIADATNVGAIVRSAAALGMDALLVTPCCCDPLNRRAARGQHGYRLPDPLDPFGVRPVRLAPSRAGNPAGPWALRRRRWPCGRTRSAWTTPRLLSEEKLAVVLGTEGDGLSSHTIAACDYTVRIPMAAASTR